jgi:hypothetical protein
MRNFPGERLTMVHGARNEPLPMEVTADTLPILTVCTIVNSKYFQKAKTGKRLDAAPRFRPRKKVAPALNSGASPCLGSLSSSEPT